LLEKADVKRVSVSKAASGSPSLEESQPRSYDELRDTVRGDFIAFHETLQKLHGLVEDLDIPEVQRMLPACSWIHTLSQPSGASPVLSGAPCLDPVLGSVAYAAN
jgi:hypothetical protein